VEWTLAGKVFKDYDPNDDTGILTPLTLADRQDTTVTFYWADTGDNRAVSVKLKLNGRDCSAQASFDVKKPSVTFPLGFNPPPVGDIQVYISDVPRACYALRRAPAVVS
jgi:hypothetical protein